MAALLLDIRQSLGRLQHTKAFYLSMVLKPTSLTWLKSLKPDSIYLKWVFVDNFQVSMLRVGTHHDLSQCKQERNETLRSYTRRFFNTHTTIANIFYEDNIDYFQNGFTEWHLYCDIGRNHPKTIVELRNMMQRWVDQEDQEHDRYPKHDNDNGGKWNNDNRSNKGQREYSVSF
jgi:hypothetical protein